jgi:hypothetical protein
LLAGWTKGRTVPACQQDCPNDPDAAVRVVFSAIFLMQRSLTFLLCLIDLKAEQKERDDRVVMHASRPMGARHRTPRIVVSVSDKIT